MQTISRRSFCAGLGAGLGATVLPLPAFAQQTPDWARGQTIKLVAPFPPGGSVDAISRMMQPGLQQRLGATVVVENRPGAGGAVGANSVAKSAPDGTSILVVFDSHAVLPALLPLQYDSRKDLDPVMLIGTAPMVLACHPSRPFKSLKDVIDASKAKPDSLTYGTVGNGSLGHLLMVLLGKKGGFVTRHLPYRGGGPAVNDAVGGHIDLIIGSAALLAAQIEAGAVRPLMQSGATRAPTLKDVPTIAESGFPGSEAYAWWGVFVRAGTPAGIKDRIYADLKASLEDSSVRPKLETGQQVKLELSGAKEFADFFEKQMQVWGEVVKENGIKPD
jgi:tripartite-type tricarboxylate transporter receptor subunit TctC